MKDYSAYTDVQLLLMLAGSDQQVFTELYNRYHTGIYSYLLAFVKIPSISEDLTQEVFLKVWEARKRLQVHTSFAAYIYRISRNTAIDFMKKIAADRELRNEIILHKESFFHDISSSSQLLAKEYSHLYKQAIDSLSQQRRTVFLLCREEGKTYKEVARLLGISRHTVKEHMTKSLHNLRDFLSEKTESALPLAILFWLF